MHANNNQSCNYRPARLATLAATGALALLLAACATPGELAKAPTPPAVAAGAAPAECHPIFDITRRQYIVGYGSLMEESSRKRTSPSASEALPATVKGFRRAWIARGSAVGFSTTFLGVVPDADAVLNAVVYELPYEEAERTDARERSYCRAAVPPDRLRMHGGFPAPDGEVWIYVGKPENSKAPDARYPIVQSYVDIFLSGCLQAQDKLGAEGFARECVRTTHGWSKHWVNDRIYPRRPFIHQPRAFTIDRLLKDEIPEYFDAIRIE